MIVRDASDLAFMAKHLVQVTLPHRDPGDVPFWSRTNGDLTLVIARTQIDQEANQLIGYPVQGPSRGSCFTGSPAARRSARRAGTWNSVARCPSSVREVGAQS